MRGSDFGKFHPPVPDFLRNHPPSFILIHAHPLVGLHLLKAESLAGVSGENFANEIDNLL